MRCEYDKALLEKIRNFVDDDRNLLEVELGGMLRQLNDSIAVNYFKLERWQQQRWKEMAEISNDNPYAAISYFLFVISRVESSTLLDKFVVCCVPPIAEHLEMVEEYHKVLSSSHLKDNVIYLNFDDRDIDVSDGYYTFDQLYFQRAILFATLCKTYKKEAWRSKLHNDGTMDDGYFIAGIKTPDGMFSYHFKNIYWHLFAGVKVLDKAPELDADTEKDIYRLKSLTGWGSIER